MKKINIAFQVGPSEDIDGVLAYCAEHGIRSYSLRALLAAFCRFMGRVAMRLTDIVVSLSLLLTLFPLLYIVAAIVIKRRSPGPAIVIEPALLADGRRCGLFNFRTEEPGERPLIARAPRLINILLGQLSLFGKAPVPIEVAEPVQEEIAEPVPMEAEESVPMEAEEPVPMEVTGSVPEDVAVELETEPQPQLATPAEPPSEEVENERINAINNTEKENNVISE